MHAKIISISKSGSKAQIVSEGSTFHCHKSGVRIKRDGVTCDGWTKIDGCTIWVPIAA